MHLSEIAMPDSDAPVEPVETRERLPALLRPLFWDHHFDDLDFSVHREFVIGRILSHGDWASVQWLREQVGDAPLRHWIERREARGLSPRQIRFWELVLRLPSDQVARWLIVQKQNAIVPGTPR